LNDGAMDSTVSASLLVVTKYAVVVYFVLNAGFNIWIYFKTRNLDYLSLFWTNDNKLTYEGLTTKQTALWRIAQISRWLAGICIVALIVGELLNLIFLKE